MLETLDSNSSSSSSFNSDGPSTTLDTPRVILHRLSEGQDVDDDGNDNVETDSTVAMKPTEPESRNVNDDMDTLPENGHDLNVTIDSINCNNGTSQTDEDATQPLPESVQTHVHSHTDDKSPTTTTTTTTTPHIRFGGVDVALYTMTLGSNPGGSCGPPIELGDFLQLEHYHTLEGYFAAAHPGHDPAAYKLALRLSRAARDAIVEADGQHDEDDIAHAIRAAFDIRMSRNRRAREDIDLAMIEEERAEHARQLEMYRQVIKDGGRNNTSNSGSTSRSTGTNAMHKKRTGRRTKKSVSWLSPSFLGRESNASRSNANATTTAVEVGSSSSGNSSPSLYQNGTIHEEKKLENDDDNDVPVSSTMGGVVKRRTCRRQKKSMSCPSGLFASYPPLSAYHNERELQQEQQQETQNTEPKAGTIGDKDASSVVSTTAATTEICVQSEEQVKEMDPGMRKRRTLRFFGRGGIGATTGRR